MIETKQYIIKQTDTSHKEHKNRDFQRFSESFQDILKDQRDSGFDYETFPDGEDFIDLQNTSNSLNINYIEGKYDKAFYYSLRKVQWNLFLSIQYRKLGLKSKTESSHKRRRDLIRRIFKITAGKLGLSNNDLQYFCFEERNQLIGSHLHLVVHCKRPDKASVEATKDTLLWLLQRLHRVIVIPNGHTKHVQTVDYSDRTLKYCLKLKLDENEKPFFHSFDFIRFYHRHLKWTQGEDSKIWQTITSTTSSTSGLNP